jgi:hypothetical protein
MFVQIIEGRTKDGKALAERGESWQKELKPGATGYLGVTAGTTADGRAITIARFESEAAARANSERPEQGEWWAETAKLYDGEPTFTESSDVTEWMGGGSNDAGFVQVMKSTGAVRAKLEEMDKAFEPHMGSRPDILGGLRIWTGKDTCVDVAYFTSEAEARKGEKAEMPAELQELMAGMQEGMGQVEYFDLTEPQLR